MAIYWPTLCGNETEEWSFWSDNYTWLTDDPDFTICFQKTVLQWIPSGYLWLCSLFYIPLLFKWKTERDNVISKMSVFKAFFSILLIGCVIVELTRSYQDLNAGNYAPQIQFLNPCIEIATLILAIFLVLYEYACGIHSSGIMFFFWFLELLYRSLVSYSSIRAAKNKTSDLPRSVAVWASFVFVLINFLVSCCADYTEIFRFRRPLKKYDSSDEKTPLLSSTSHSSSGSKRRLPNPSPEITASFLKRITFTWITGLMVRGFKRTLNSGDIWDLRLENSSSHIVPRTSLDWDKQIFKTFDKNRKRKLVSEDHPAVERQDGSIDTYLAINVIRSINETQKNKSNPSFVAILLHNFGGYFFLAGFLKLISDALLFLQPQLLKKLINFISVGDPYLWHGYFMAVSLFIVASFRSFLTQQYFHGVFLTGMRLRTAVVGLVYKKALRLAGSARKNTTVGEIVNLMSIDAQKFQDAPTFLHIIWTAPVSIAVALYFIWQELGPSALAGLVLMIVLVPINGVIISKARKLQISQMRLKDQRMKLMSDLLSGIKVLKLYAWEQCYAEKVNDIRNQELLVLRKANLLTAFSSITWFCAPFLVSITTFAAYVFSSKDHVLTAEKAFVSFALFNIMNFPMAVLPGALAYLVQFTVSLSRIKSYLLEEELDPHALDFTIAGEAAVNIHSGNFAWDHYSPSVLTNMNVSIEHQKLYAVVGAVGSGKTSLLNAILGELVKRNGRILVSGSFAYVPQQAWFQNCSVKDNILFGRRMCRARYEYILDACALRPDLSVLPAGDETEIGENGINLSGGQKQRISLARALYQDCDIYLMDDPLAAVDVHVGKHIFEQVVSKDGLLGAKTRILVTNNVAFMQRVDNVIFMKAGRVVEIAPFDELMVSCRAFADFLRSYFGEEEEEEEESTDNEKKRKTVVQLRTSLRRTIQLYTDSEIDSASGLKSVRKRRHSPHSQKSSSSTGEPAPQPVPQESPPKPKWTSKLTREESMETGSVKWSVYKTYVKSLTVPIFVTCVISYFCYVACQIGTNLWLSVWSDDASTFNNTKKRDLYLGVYGALGAAQAIFIFLQCISLAFGSYYASSKMHEILLSNIIRTPMSFFDATPVGRLLNRFGKDIDTLDINVPMNTRMWLSAFSTVVGTVVVVSIASPIVIVGFIVLGVWYYFVQRFYISSSRQLKRLDSVKRSPIYSHFQATVAGASSIRAFGRQTEFVEKSFSLLDDNQSVWFVNIVAYRWLGVMLEMIGNIIIFLAALFAVISHDYVGAGLSAAAVTYALQMTGSLNFMVRVSCDLENCAVGVERILEYTKQMLEAPWKTLIEVPLWPQHGQIRFTNYSLRYRPDLDDVIISLNATIKPGEKVGIVGRTGAGKSSLTLGLFRILEASGGSVEIDGIDISRLGLHDLRSRLTIIPQDPILFSGTLRMNLDPFDKHTDGQIWSALDQAHLKTFVSSLPDGLMHECAEGGENLSVGQRQLVCLARALLRKTKVLVLDEATAAVDLETDDLIQNTIRREFRGCTILTIAHRLNTIMDYDTVMVLDKGKLVDYDTPTNLLNRKNSVFYKMCSEEKVI